MNTYRDTDEDEYEWDDAEIDSGDGSEDSSEEPTVLCPYCKEEILEDSPCCPYCEQYISEEDHTGPRKPMWVFLTALVCLAAALWLVFAAR